MNALCEISTVSRAVTECVNGKQIKKIGDAAPLN